MRLVRLDAPAPGSGPLELHPRLTLLVGAPRPATELIVRTVRSLLDGTDPPTGGLLDVHGIQLPLDRSSLADLGLGPLGEGGWILDPVVYLGDPTPSPPPEPSRTRSVPPVGPSGDPQGTAGPVTRPDAASPAGPSAREAAGDDPARHSRQRAEEELRNLRSELRSVTGELMVLARRTEEARSGLDSFARADLLAAREQVEGLGVRLQQAEADHDSWVEAAESHRATLQERRSELIRERERLEAADPEPVRQAADRLSELLNPSERPDPATALLADRLESLMAAEEDRRSRKLEASALIEGVRARLAEAEAELALIDDRTRRAVFDPEVVRRLEEVRDQIFELEERQGRVSRVSGRSRRRADELRAQEAELLDRLGFDTYSSFVMGIPTARAEAERTMRIDAARARVESLREHLQDLEAVADGGAEERADRAERDTIVAEAARILGAEPERLGRLTSVELTELLRSRTLTTSPAVEVLSAAGRLAAALAVAGEEPPSTAIDPAAMLDRARSWLAELNARPERLEELSSQIADVDRQLLRLSRERSPDDGGRLADLRVELASAEERAASAEERLQRHLAAMAELAEARAEELELRRREVELEDAIVDLERLLEVIDVPSSEPTASLPMGPVPAGRSPVPGRPLGVPRTSGSSDELSEPTSPGLFRPEPPRTPSRLGPVSREWRVLSRMADLQKVGVVGSVPVLVCDLATEGTDTEALLHRIEVMSELIQVVATTDDDRVAAWAEGLADRAAVVRWAAG